MSIETVEDIDKIRGKTSIIMSQGMLIGQSDVTQRQLKSPENENKQKAKRPFGFLNRTSP